MSEAVLAARVLDALLREDYGGLRSTGPPVRLSRDAPHAGFLADAVVDPAQGLRLDDVFAIVRRAADPRDDVDAFERECRDALAATRLHREALPSVLDRLGRVPDGRRRGPGTFYETLAAHTDHPVHPASRCRSGLDAADLRRYAPEFAPEFAMRWTAAPEAAEEEGERPGWLPEGLFPVHPLTVPHVEATAPGPELRVAPTLSMRSVAVDPLTHLKVPLPTSTLGLRNVRAIVPRTLRDGARAERLLRRVLDEEPALPVLLADEQTHGHAGTPWLAYLVRRFPPETADAHVVPVAALLAPAPEGGRVIERWDVAALFRDYLDALFRWNVALFRRGIALEAHQQNVALVLGDGPLRLLVKDYDGTLVLGGRGFTDPRMETTDPDALARVFVTITLHLCAAAPAFGLAERGLLPRRTALAMVRDALDAALGPGDAFLRSRTLDAAALPSKAMVTAGTLVGKDRTGAADINKHYGPPGPNYLRRPDDPRDDTCC